MKNSPHSRPANTKSKLLLLCLVYSSFWLWSCGGLSFLALIINRSGSLGFPASIHIGPTTPAASMFYQSLHGEQRKVIETPTV
jgi:hypothetical protein